MMNKKVEIRFRDSKLKKDWKGINDKVPVNPQYCFETEER